MNHIGIFFNNRFLVNNYYLTDPSVAVGDVFLTPLRYLCNGNVIRIMTSDQKHTYINHDKEFSVKHQNSNIKFLKVAASIALLVPGLILGSLFKALGYLSHSAREQHHLAIEHFTRVDYVLGSPSSRVALEDIALQLSGKSSNLNQKARNIIVYAKCGTEIIEDPGFAKLNPEKIILVGAKLIHRSGFNPVDEKLLHSAMPWEQQIINSSSSTDQSLVKQWKKGSVVEAVNDMPAFTAFFSLQRYSRVYNI